MKAPSGLIKDWVPHGTLDSGSLRWALPLTPFAAAALYFAVSAVWILVSDNVLLLLSAGNETFLAQGQTNKGLIFVALSTGLVYFLIRRSHSVVETVSSELAASLQRRAELLDALYDPVVTLDPQGRITTVNVAGARVVGYAREEILGRSMHDFIAPPDRLRIIDAFSHLMRGQPIGVEVTVMRKDGSTLPFEFQGMPLKDPAGQVVGAVSSGRDISRRVEAEAKVRRHLFGLETTLRQTIVAIATMVEKRDGYLAGHQNRVSVLALAIADRMGLDQHRREGLQHASICHDIGKIQIPSEILSKPTKLTDAEFAMIKVHPEAGFEILNKIDFPWPLAEIVRQHHERFDGSGYPRGLVGEQILLEARILAVADTVEAMTSHRPYRPAVGPDAALQEIRRGRGTLYDAAVVDVCLALFEEGHFEFGSRAA
jgi:PAS domain S-box-containing protein/putative nucleotidyltransferase with HDIG domain